MKCAEFETRLNDILDQRRRPDSDAELRQHVHDCHECRRQADAYLAVLTGLGPVESPEACAELTQRVLAEVRGPKLQVRSPIRLPRHMLRRPAGMALLAALVAVVAVPLFWFGSPPERQRSGSLAGAGAPQTAPAKADISHEAPQPLPIGSLATEATDSYRVLATETKQSVAAALQIVPGVGVGFRQPEPPVATTTQSPPWVRGLTDGLQPVTRSTTGALSSFLKVIDMDHEGDAG